MANHVNSYLQFRSVNEEGKKVIQNIVERFDKHKNNHECPLAYTFVDNLDDIDMEFMHENVGAKWAYAQDWDTDGFSMVSAWSIPEAFVLHVVEKVGDVDPNSIAILTYEDEMPNFIGVDIYIGGDTFDGEELSDDEVREELLSRYTELAELWDEDEEDWTDDGEAYFDHLWDFIDTWQNEFIDHALKELEE